MSIRQSNTDRVLHSGSTIGERMRHDLLTFVQHKFSSSPSYFEVFINNNPNKTGVYIVDDSVSINIINQNSKNIIMQPNDILSTGDIITDETGQTWLCIASELYGGMYYTGKITRATHTLQLYKNTVLYQLPITVESNTRLYSMRQDDNKFFTELSDNIIVRTPNNEISQLLKIDDVYQIGRYRYKILNVQDVIEPGLLVVKLQITTEDIEPIPEPEPTEFYIEGADSIIINREATYTVDSEADVVFTLEGDLAMITRQDGNQCTVKAGGELGYVTLIATIGEMEARKEIKIRHIF